MKTNIKERQVQFEAGETNDFTIKANGKAFRALISGLYENKIQSIVREIWSNALDAHIAAGCEDRPFLVTFPTMFNPTFVVRDYGVSLEHSEVMKLYTTVFESTKEDTNDSTGKFGLGSKSPFAYTDTFSVVVVKDGDKRFYSAVIGKTGIPAIHFLGQEETTEENGVEVSFPIQSSDISAFRRAANRVSHGFATKPEVLRREDEEEFGGWPELEVLSSGADWTLMRGVIEGYRSQAYAKMGPVLYPINEDAIDDLGYEERKLLGATLLIEFDMGELEMTPSREALSYGSDEPTIPSIRRKLRRIQREMVATFQAEYDACDTYWEACLIYRSHIIGSAAPEPIRDSLKKSANWKGRKLQILLEYHAWDLPGVDTCLIEGSRLNNAMYRFSKSPSTSIPIKENVVFYVEEEGKDQRTASKIKFDIFSRDSSDRPGTVVWLRTFQPHHSLNKTMSFAAAKLQAFYDDIDGAEIVMVADLPEAPRTYSGGGGSGVRRPVQVRVWDGYDFDRRAEVTFEDGGYYVPLERMQPVYPGGMLPPRYVWSALLEAGVVPAGTTLHGAPKSLWKKFESDAWVNIYDLALEAFKKSKPKASLSKRALIRAVSGTASLRWLSEVFEEANDLQDGAAKSALEFYNKVTGWTVPDVSGFISLAKAVGEEETIQDWSQYDATEIDYHVEALETYYPLLSVLQENMRYGRKPVDKIAEYVQMCDKVEATDSKKRVAEAA